MKLIDKIKNKLASINLVSVAFFALSIFSIAFAWFAYTNTVSTNFQADVKTWKIEITNNNQEVSNEVNITVDDLYPGMSNYTNTFNIQNLEQIAAQIDYKITYLRVFDTVVSSANNLTFYEIERNYPFKLHFEFNKRYLDINDTATLSVLCTWALDSEDDDTDTYYGNLAYNFYQQEQQQHAQNSSYQIRSGIELKVEVTVSQYTDTPSSFSTDSWNTIQLAVERGQTSNYSVGNTKTISIGGTNYTLRISNKTNSGSICTGSSNSQTACGFVVEFVDIISQRPQNTTSTNTGSWPATELYQYANGDFFSSLPYELKKVIAPTKVISGHGSGDSNNIESNDMIYLLSGVEVLGTDSTDTAASTTRKLDYYTTNSAEANRIKKFNNSNAQWWLRSYADASRARTINTTGYINMNSYVTYSVGGFAPAFRIK